MAYVDDRPSYIQGLREFADFLEDNPEFNLDWVPDYISVYCYGEEAFKSQAKALGGKREKEFTDYSVNVNREFSGLTIKVNTNRDNVCTRRKVGTKTVTKNIPVSHATMEVEVEEDVYETDCAVIIE